MEREPRDSGGRAWLALLVFGVLVAGYLGALRATIGVTEVNSDRDAAVRDQVYLVLHGGLLMLGGIAGFAAGRWINGLGLAWAVLLMAALAVTMVTVQVASFELACEAGHNGLVRHWHC